MVRGNAATIVWLLLVPGIPRANRIADMPDALAPHDILQVEGGAVVHDPHGDGLAFGGADLFRSHRQRCDAKEDKKEEQR